MHILEYKRFITESNEENLYTFDQLSTKAQQNAIERNREPDLDYEWESPIIEGFREEMEKCGIRDVKCMFSGFYSQGDGASFTGEVFDNRKFIFETLDMGRFDPWPLLDRVKSAAGIREEILKTFNEDLHIRITRRPNSNYVHENTVSVDVNYYNDEDFYIKIGLEGEVLIDLDVFLHELEMEAIMWVREKSKGLYRDLENYYEELTSDEGIADNLRSGGYEFDEMGNMI
jgi:hypothetical protein